MSNKYSERRKQQAKQVSDLYDLIIRIERAGSSLTKLYDEIKPSQYRVFILLCYSSFRNKLSLYNKAVLKTEVYFLKEKLTEKINAQIRIAQKNKKEIAVIDFKKQKEKLEREFLSFENDKEIKLMDSQLKQFHENKTLAVMNDQFFETAENSLLVLRKKAPLKLKFIWLKKYIHLCKKNFLKNI
jgi:hypothetical protein